jgi:hypothetical protein
MKKNLWLVLSFLLLAVIIGTVFIVTKPSDMDYANWMEDRYPLRCADKLCDVFDINVNENGHDKTITMQSVYGGLSPGTFVMQRDFVYRANENPSYQLDLEISGYLGKIHVVKEHIKLKNN